jgi:hypothetical protein
VWGGVLNSALPDSPLVPHILISMKAKLLSLPLSALLLFAACQNKPTVDAPEQVTIGFEIEDNDLLTLAVVDTTPADYFEQTLLVEATVTAVCEKMGCWMQVEDKGHTAMVRWEAGCGGEFAFPTEMVGKRVQIQGSFYPKTLSEEDAEHIQGETTSDVTVPLEGYEFNASAVRFAAGSK